eukprot:1087320-Heterocapsa_arctica.AAC.1
MGPGMGLLWFEPSSYGGGTIRCILSRLRSSAHKPLGTDSQVCWLRCGRGTFKCGKLNDDRGALTSQCFTLCKFVPRAAGIIPSRADLSLLGVPFLNWKAVTLAL